MNLFTLNFKVSQIEHEFRESKQKLFSKILIYQKWIFGMINFISIVNCLISKNWIIASISLGSLVLILISIKVNQKYSYVYKVAILLYILLFNSYMTLNLEENFANTYSLYTEAFFITFTFASLSNLLSFIQRATLLLIMVTFHLIFEIQHSNVNIETFIRYILCVFLYVQFTYQFEKLLRLQFLEQQKYRKFLNKIYKYEDVQSYSIKYDEQKSLILIEKNNSKKMLKEDKEEFLNMINNMQLSMQNKQSQVSSIVSIDNILSPKIKSLKQLLFQYAQEKESEISDTPSKYRQEIQLYGFYQQQVYQTNIFRSFDINGVTILLIKESKSEEQKDQLKFRMRNNQKQLQYIQEIFDSQIKKSLIYFKWIHNFANKQTDIRLINRTLNIINQSLSRGYTEFLNMELFTLQQMQSPGIKQFNLYLLIQNVVQFYQGYFDQRPETLRIIQQFEIINNLSNNSIIISDFKYIKLLLLNLIHFTSQNSQTITINLDEVKTDYSQNPIIRIKISYQAPSLTKDQLQKLPILNPQSLQELKHNSVAPLDLDLVVSLILIRRLGPYDKLKIVQQKRKSNFLEFYLFQQLTEDFLMIPIKSMKPSDKIKIQEYSFVANSFSSSYHFESIRDSLHLL